MKKLFLVLSFFLTLLSAKKTAAQAFSLFINYTSSERGRDSHSTMETFSLDGKNLSYTVAYSGRKGPDQKDEEKKYVLTDEQIKSIYTTLQEKNLKIEDSLIGSSSSNQGTYSYKTITITVKKGKNTTKVRVMGTYKQLSEKTLFINSLYLINSIRKMLKIDS